MFWNRHYHANYWNLQKMTLIAIDEDSHVMPDSISGWYIDALNPTSSCLWQSPLREAGTLKYPFFVMVNSHCTEPVYLAKYILF